MAYIHLQCATDRCQLYMVYISVSTGHPCMLSSAWPGVFRKREDSAFNPDFPLLVQVLPPVQKKKQWAVVGDVNRGDSGRTRCGGRGCHHQPPGLGSGTPVTSVNTRGLLRRCRRRDSGLCCCRGGGGRDYRAAAPARGGGNACRFAIAAAVEQPRP